ncbi:MAG: hypothetical protein CMJ50_02045 [Planctomycetaceae bacterium]|nr:hypothetical protein [Planctomycetaceae bacterium]
MKSDPTASDRDDQLARLLAQMTDDAQRGLPVDIDRICREHPDLSGELRELWGAVMVAEAIGSGSQTAADETDSAHDNAALSFELPCRFGDYTLLAEVGRGGMGVVYRARQISLNREVAVKMILRGQLASDVDRERFRAEAEAAAGLHHPGIVPVYEVGDIDDHPFFSMKLVNGRTLSQRLAEGLMLPREAAEILAAVATAVHFAHRQGVLHRDLKPSNILIDQQGDPHVMDFGLAKQTLATANSLTHSGAILGTPSYMSPEQAAGGREPVGPGSDVFSLGTILYQTLTGRPPFQAASPVDTILMLRDQDVVPPRIVNPRADRVLEIIALRCLQKPVKLRYDTARALAEDLEAYLNDEPIAASRGRFADVVAGLFRETHHATILEHWGLLWMWHSLVLFIACALTNALQWYDFRQRWVYIIVWTEGLIVIDSNDRIILANSSFATTMNTSAKSLIGRKASSLNWEVLQDSSTDEPYPWVQALKDGNRQLGRTLALKGADGKRSIFKINTSPITGSGGKSRGALISFDDVTLAEENHAEMRDMLSTLSRSRDDISRQNRELEMLATRDPLTSCLNRRAFFQEVDTHWWNADQYERELSCLMVDVDHFKSINDNHGHSVGDSALQKVGEILRTDRRDCDLVCRYGGEEFCIFLPNADSEDAASVGESIRLAVEAAVFDNDQVTITISIGISSRNLGARDFQEMIDEADQCLLVAKRNGRNQVVRWDQIDEYPEFGRGDATKDGDERESDCTSRAVLQEESIPFHAVTALVSALSYRDPTTADHSRRVADLCAATADGLMSQREILVLETAGMLHDIGKIGVPDAILLKNSELTEEEWHIMRRNERVGAEIIQTTFASQKLAEIVKMYRAWYGGNSRHPELPIGDKIPVGARILAIADAYDSMVNDRSYRKGRTREEAFQELRRCTIKQFDPDLVERFMDVVALRPREGESCGESKAVVLNLGIQIERLADAMEKQDVTGIGALASRLNMAAVKHGLDEVAETAGKLEATVVAGPAHTKCIVQ